MAEMKGLGKLGGTDKGEGDPLKREQGKTVGQSEGEEATTTITHHGDGSHTVRTGDGQEEHHPDHLHAGAHVLHHMSGGDKHHIVHHDGVAAHSHSIHEDGQHEDHGEHNSAEEAKGALDKFLGEEAQEPEHQHEGEQEPAYGAM
jgi:hypothetical protein